jgi:hypothetical protein
MAGRMRVVAMTPAAGSFALGYAALPRSQA